MTDAPELITPEAARADHRERTLLHATQCICFAVVTSEPLAAELIDRAIDLRTAADLIPA